MIKIETLMALFMLLLGSVLCVFVKELFWPNWRLDEDNKFIPIWLGFLISMTICIMAILILFD